MIASLPKMQQASPTMPPGSCDAEHPVTSTELRRIHEIGPQRTCCTADCRDIENTTGGVQQLGEGGNDLSQQTITAVQSLLIWDQKQCVKEIAETDA